MRIRRRAAAEKAQRFCSHDRVPHARGDEDRIARTDCAMFAIELYLARAVENEIKLLRVLMIMPLCPGACGDARFRKALVLDGRIRAIEDRTDSRAVLRDKRRLGGEILDGHGFSGCRDAVRDGSPISFRLQKLAAKGHAAHRTKEEIRGPRSRAVGSGMRDQKIQVRDQRIPRRREGVSKFITRTAVSRAYIYRYDLCLYSGAKTVMHNQLVLLRKALALLWI